MLNFRPLAGLPGTLVVIALLGSMATLGVSNTDLANFITNSAEARALDQKTQAEAQKTSIELEAYRQVENAKAQAEQNRILLEFEMQKKHAELALEQSKAQYQIELEQQRYQAEQQLRWERITRYTFLIIGVLVTLVLCYGMVYRFLKSEQRQSIGYSGLQINSSVMNHRWHTDPAWKQDQIALARNRERSARANSNNKGKTSSITALGHHNNGQGNVPWKDLPRVE